jgi:hypothetical protein
MTGMSDVAGMAGTAGMEVVAVDWSGARTPGHQWWAVARQGRLLELQRAGSRQQLVSELVARGARATAPMVVGLDFAFSLPEWYLDRHQLGGAAALWDYMAEHAERLLAACEPPFWGRPGRRRPDLPAHWRRTEQAVAAVGGIRPKSAFQIGGAGAVGTGSLRGMPFLAQLQRAGFAIWPFDPPRDRTVVEIYPRLLTGPVVKRDPAARRAVLGRYEREGVLDPALAERAAESEDAFDAAVSALEMSRHQPTLATLGQATDRVALLEGEIWEPPPGRPPPPRRVTSARADRPRATPTGAPAYTERYVAALEFAATLHVTQRRKGSGVPYLAHLLAVSALVWETGGDEDQAIAGLLHDAVEDQGGPPTLEVIRARFGPRVAAMVEACTDAVEVPKPPWRPRKEAFLVALHQAPADALVVVAADKLHNATAIVCDLEARGADVWGRFTGGREGTVWYYRQVYERLAARHPATPVDRLVDRLGDVVGRLEVLAAT